MIYFLEDDKNIRDFVLYTLNAQGFKAMGFERPSIFWNAMDEETPSLILLDIMLPEEDGLSILRKLRGDKATAKLPVIMLTAKGEEEDERAQNLTKSLVSIPAQTTTFQSRFQ